MYGMKPKRRFIEHALKLLDEHSEDGIVVVFHRDGDLNFDGLVCHHTASFPTGIVRIATNDETLDRFTSFIAGFTIQDVKMDEVIRGEWRKLCHVLGRREEAYPDHLLFSSPDISVANNINNTYIGNMDPLAILLYCQRFILYYPI